MREIVTINQKFIFRRICCGFGRWTSVQFLPENGRSLDSQRYSGIQSDVAKFHRKPNNRSVRSSPHGHHNAVADFWVVVNLSEAEASEACLPCGYGSGYNGMDAGEFHFKCL